MLPHYRWRTAGVQLSFAGRVEAKDDVALAFRIPDRLIENSGTLKDRVQPGQVLAKLEPQNALLGIDVTLVSDQPVVVKNAIGEFMESLWQAIAIIMACGIVSLEFRPGAVVALSIPLTVAIIFPIMEFFEIDLQRILPTPYVIFFRASDPESRLASRDDRAVTVVLPPIRTASARLSLSSAKVART